MKKSKIVFLILAIVMLVGTMTACATDATEVTVSLRIVAGEDVIYDGEAKVNDKAPTVLMAFEEACIANEISYELDANKESVKKIKDYDDVETDGTFHFWIYKINGVEPDANTAGKAKAYPIENGMKIEFEYTTYVPETTVAETTVAA